MRRAVFLDRDGVLNRAAVHAGIAHSPARLDEVEIMPGALEACNFLQRAGFLLIVVTNQPDVARGIIAREDVEGIHAHLRHQLALDDVRVCYHDNRDGCLCRKPLPGLLIEAARDWQINLKGSFLIGDRWRDIEAGRRAGCRTILIEHPYDQGTVNSDFRTPSFLEAAYWIVQQNRGEGRG